MASMKIKLTIENLDRTIEMEVGQDIRSALLENDIPLYAPKHKHTNCHGKGLCTTCQIELVEAPGVSDQGAIEKLRVGAERRLACQARNYQDAVIRTVHQPDPALYEV